MAGEAAVRVEGLGRAAASPPLSALNSVRTVASPPLSALNSVRTVVDSTGEWEVNWGGSARSFGRLKGLRGLRFTVTDDVPFLFPALLLSLQHVVAFVGVTTMVVSSTIEAMGGTKADVARGISAALLAGGLGTLLAVTFGSRLPILVGPTFAHCFGVLGVVALRKAGGPSPSFEALAREVQGALISASAAQIFFGASGLARVFARLLSPVSLAPIIIAIGLTTYTHALQGVLACPEVGAVQMLLVCVLSQYLGKRARGGGARGLAWLASAETYSVLIPTAISWTVAAIVGEATGGFAYRSEASAAFCRLDRHSAVGDTPWLSFPPLFFALGTPTFTWEAFLVMLSTSAAATWESVGCYNAAARVAGAPLPRASAVSRGVAAEGLWSLASALVVVTAGLGCQSAGVGLVGTTKVGSRRAVQLAAAWLVLLACVSKAGACLAAAPLAIVCGTLCCTSGLVSSVGLAIGQVARLNSPRNLFIMGFALFNGLAAQTHLKIAPSGGGVEAEAGEGSMDAMHAMHSVALSLPQLILWEGLVKNPLLMCGGLALLLDTTVPAADAEERGLHIWRRGLNERYQKVYFLPQPICRLIRACHRPCCREGEERELE